VSKTTASRGHLISYEDEGNGNPIVLIPPYMLSAEDFRRVGLLARLADRWRVLAVDPLGHGKSDKPHEPTPYRSPRVAADMIAVLDDAEIDKAVLWGYSRGAWLAMMAAVEFPERLSGVIVGGGGFTDPPPTTVPAWVEPLTRGDWRAFWEVFPLHLDDEGKERIEHANDPKALAAERIGRTESAYRFDLSRVTAPALIYCGGEDGPEEAVPSAKALNTELHVIEGRDHGGAFDDVDAVMAFAVPFLERVTGATSQRVGTS
jgi:pimeloyl-ACP methyl ester carboxylesterase